MAAAAAAEDGHWLGRLQDELRACSRRCFAQARPCFTAFAYIGALRAGRGNRRSCWQLAAGGARDATADAGAARRAQPGLEGSAGRAAEVRARVLVRHRSHVDQQSGISPTLFHLRGIEKAGQEIPENLIHRKRRSLRA